MTIFYDNTTEKNNHNIELIFHGIKSKNHRNNKNKNTDIYQIDHLLFKEIEKNQEDYFIFNDIVVEVQDSERKNFKIFDLIHEKVNHLDENNNHLKENDELDPNYNESVFKKHMNMDYAQFESIRYDIKETQNYDSKKEEDITKTYSSNAKNNK